MYRSGCVTSALTNTVCPDRRLQLTEESRGTVPHEVVAGRVDDRHLAFQDRDERIGSVPTRYSNSPTGAERSSPISARAASCEGESSGLAGADTFHSSMRAIDAEAGKPLRPGSHPRSRRSRLAPLEEEIPLGEVATTVNPGEGVKVTERGDHELAVLVPHTRARDIASPRSCGVASNRDGKARDQRERHARRSRPGPGWCGRVRARRLGRSCRRAGSRRGGQGALLDEALGAEAQLFGRRTSEFLAARWPSRSGELADRLNDMPKYVVFLDSEGSRLEQLDGASGRRHAGGLEVEGGARRRDRRRRQHPARPHADGERPRRRAAADDLPGRARGRRAPLRRDQRPKAGAPRREPGPSTTSPTSPTSPCENV